jgi:molybdopterin-containing oxidoreductase family iron-sulfur binding subunit
MFVSPKTAKDLGYNPASDSILQVSAKPLSDLDRGRQTAPIVTLNVDGAMIKAPLMIQPGLADDTALIHLGYGHTKYGRNAEGFGVNVFPLIKHSGIYSFASVDIKLTSEKTFLACTQNHWSIEGRDHYREGDREDFEKNEEFAKDAHSVLGKAEEMSLSERSREMPRGLSAFEHPKYTAAQQWGLSIDLSACTGCNACVIACQSENNIPTVGREQILRGREMHWIRIDRYYASGNAAANNKEIPGDVDVGLQPMTCQHCERAPCEQVCPVNATVHDEQGLNVMAYNRCVGTRYCANNCPYKVRRFNFFDYAKRNRENYYWGMFGPEGMPDILKLQKNPDVTIRSRGVMEKCTLCVQRIEQSKIRQRLIAKDGGNVHVKDGIIRTACQQVCPTQAIVFGDVADEKTEVSRLKHSPRDYSALAYLNTRPRITYLARLRNQNRAMPDVRGILRFRLEQGDKSEHSKEI